MAELYSIREPASVESASVGRPVWLLDKPVADLRLGVYYPARVSYSQEGVREGERRVQYTADRLIGLERVVGCRSQTFVRPAGRSFPALIEVRQQTAHTARTRARGSERRRSLQWELVD